MVRKNYYYNFKLKENILCHYTSPRTHHFVSPFLLVRIQGLSIHLSKSFTKPLLTFSLTAHKHTQKHTFR